MPDPLGALVGGRVLGSRAMIERVATSRTVEIELGPETREVMAHFFDSRGDSSVREKIGGFVGRATEG